MVGMTTFVESDHPRRITGQFAGKRNDAPTSTLEAPSAQEWLPAGDGCTCLVNPNPYAHYGIVEPGDALEADPDCPVHFPAEAPDAHEAWLSRNEEWARDADAGIAVEPDPSSGTADAWASSATPF